MHLILTSISRKILDLDTVESVTLPTKKGEITVLENHMAMITALNPGIITVRFEGKASSFAIGGGIVEMSDNTLTVAADMVEEGSKLDLATVRAKKEEARKLLEEYRNTKGTIDMDRYIAIEYEFLKESAKEQLATGNI